MPTNPLRSVSSTEYSIDMTSLFVNIPSARRIKDQRRLVTLPY